MSTIRTFRDLIAWQPSKKTVLALYRHTQQMPDSERFGLTSQMRRAAVSNPSNIAEVYGSGTTAGFLRHLRIPRGSLAELNTQVEIAGDLQFAPQNSELLEILGETDRVLQGPHPQIGTKTRD